MAVSNKERQARHRQKHPEREQTRQASKRARFKSWQTERVSTSGHTCADKGKGKGPCAGKIQFHHDKGYGSGKAMQGCYLCQKHHEMRDKQA